MRKSLQIAIHISYWLLYLLLYILMLLPIWLFSFENASEQYFKNFISFLFLSPFWILAFWPAFLNFYFCYTYLFEKYFIPKRYGLLFVLLLMACIGSSAMGHLLLYLLPNTKISISSNPEGLTATYILMIVIAAIHGIIALIIRGFFQYYTENKLREILKQKQFETELALLKHQLDPHFLFNTLNNIDILISKDHILASTYLNKLSSLLRFMLYETKADFIALHKEMACITAYIELQKLRYANKDFIQYEIDSPIETYSNASIPPMLLIPFIENAFKHTGISKKNNCIQIKVTIRNEHLYFDCINEKSKQSVEETFVGIGLDLSKKRLQLLYEDNHTITITQNNNYYQVNLSLPLYGNNLHHH